jgi:hypothetical protein
MNVSSLCVIIRELVNKNRKLIECEVIDGE